MFHFPAFGYIMIMTMNTRKEYRQNIQEQYQKANKKEKTRLLNEYCRNTGQNRKYAIRILNDQMTQMTDEPELTLIRSSCKKSRDSKYNHQIRAALVKVWEIMDYPCGQRLAPVIKELVDRLRSLGELEINDQTTKLLKEMSPASIDRALRHEKSVQRRNYFSGTRPGTFFRDRIPVRLNDWDTSIVGNQAIDCVEHGGDSSSGEYGHTVSITDIATGWWEGQAILSKGQVLVRNALAQARQRSPFVWLGIHPDSGSEFINECLWNYAQTTHLEFTRSRPGKKNDNCYVEQKNWTHVRKIVGYHRYDTPEEIEILNELYTGPLRLYKNFFQPTMKLKEKIRDGGHVCRQYEQAKTPYQRVLELGNLDEATKEELKRQYQSLNPAELKRQIAALRVKLHEAYRKKRERSVVRFVIKQKSPQLLVGAMSS